jgi:hypothetical protein
MAILNVPGLDEFLLEYPLMALRPSGPGSIVLKGTFRFSAEHETAGTIADAFDLAITVPANFPQEGPAVAETSGRIPRTGEFHVNPGDESLCLGSPLRLQIQLAREPTLIGFAHNSLIPYLYAVSHKLKNQGSMVFGELPHGTPGIVEDYMHIFGLKELGQLHRALHILTKRKRVGNKLPCPCDCGRRTGKCRYNNILRQLRTTASRAWFAKQISSLPKVPAPTKPKRKKQPRYGAVL